MYKLDNLFTQSPFTVAVVGCGGTGGFVAEGLCRLLPPQARLVLVDHDRVEEGNLTRQNFTPEDLGRFKSEVLGLRLARRYGRPVAYAVAPIGMLGPDGSMALVIGCVDNGPARADIARAMTSHRSAFSWWLDSGNGEEFGQVLVGNADTRKLRGSFDPETGVCHALPLPTLVRPELLVQVVQEGLRPSCAQAVAAGEQGPTINQFMAALVVEAVRRLLEGKPAWWQTYLDLQCGTLHTVPASPEGVSRVTGVTVKRLIRRSSERR